MFQFSAFASPNLCIEFGMTALIALPGFPIQKSPGHSSFDNSPELIAVCYVFHRLSAPRHPPCALYSLIIHPTPSEQGLDYYPKFLNHSRGVNDSALDDLNESSSSIHSPIFSIAFFFSVFNFQPILFQNPSNEAALYTRRMWVSNYFLIFFAPTAHKRKINAAHQRPDGALDFSRGSSA